MGTSVAFLGLGIMGRPMAFHLLAHGHRVAVYNRTKAKTEGFAEKGARVADSPSAAARGAKIVFSCLADGPDVLDVLLNESYGARVGSEQGTLFVDHSTIAPQDAQSLNSQLSEKGFRFIDAPISGGQKGAQDGKLAIMCGGSQADFDEARPVLEAYGKKITLVGGPGMGQVTKACNQVLCVNNILGVAEALNLARALGADPHKVWEAVKDGAAQSWSLETLGPKMLREDDSPGFYVRHMQKDLRIVLDAARACHAPVPGAAQIHQLYKVVQNRGGDECGNHCLNRALQVMMGEDWRAATGESGS